MPARALIAAVLSAVLAFGAAGAGSGDRVGGSFWARPAVDQTSVDFYAEAALRTRMPVRAKTRFVVEAIEIGRVFPREERVYRVRFDSGEIGYIGTGAFEDALFRESRPGEADARLRGFQYKSIFEHDPDEIAARLRAPARE
jgi:hypothetical protein